MPKLLSLKALLKKKYKYLENLPEKFRNSFGDLTMGFVMVIWGESSNGKSTLTTKILEVLIKYGKVMYISLEEGHRRSMQRLAEDTFAEEAHQGQIFFGNHEMTFAETMLTLKKRKSAKIVVIDSVQYWDITIPDYKELKETFPQKIFIFISHAEGKQPDGKLAKKIKYDADIKVRVEGFIAFVRSRFQGNHPYVIYEEGARDYWGKDYAKKSTGIAKVKKAVKKKPAPVEETETEETTETEN
ncbi:MAG: hypothetical protein ACK4EY_14505 [Flavipsychrobacter sp.]